MDVMSPHVTVIVPARNEERFLERCVRGLLNGFPRDRVELFVVDGDSDDGTRAVAERLAAELPSVRVLDNPARLQAPGFNAAMREADPRSRYLIRCDAHADYPPGFLARTVEVAERTGAELVAFSDDVRSEGCFQAAVAFAQSTPVGVGDARYRLGGHTGWVDHGKHGCFRRDAVEAAGGYDESFSHNEDSELSLRLRRDGGRVWLDEEVVVGYHPRASPSALARQYLYYGRGRAATCLKHRTAPQPRQLAPPALTLWHAALLVGATRRRSLLAFPAAYLAALAAIGATGAARKRNPCLLLTPVALATMHHAWGAGFLDGLVSRFVGFRRGGGL